MATVEQSSSSASWYRAQRTQARPKHSLFGTALEHYDREDIEGIKPEEASQIGRPKPRDRYPIPEHLQKHVSARAMLEKVKGDIAGQTQQVTDIRKELQDKERQALAFKPTSSGSQHKEGESRGWMTKKDLEHSVEINAVGLSKHGSYNRDKYGHKPQTHNYALIGDVLSKGNDFGRRQTYDPNQTLIDYHTQRSNGAANTALDPAFPANLEGQEHWTKPKSAADTLPLNIKHYYGTRVCESLLSDQKAVTETLKKQNEQMKKAKPQPVVDTKDFDAKSSGNYFHIGHNTRYSVFPGHSVLDLESNTKSVHTDEVFLRREPPTDEFRMVKDAYATWAEQNLVREKLKRQWDATTTKPAQ